MIYPLLENFAAKGGWLGVVPQLTASYAVIAPWTGPQFIKYRMTEFVDKKVRTLSAYATPHNRLYDFNVTAAAEWSWNAHGRSEHQFATAYATRHRIKDPDAFADWAIMIGPVSWDVYGSKMPYHYFRGETARMIANRSRPALGKERSMFRYFPTVEHMDHDLAVCRKAMEIALRLDMPAALAETRAIEGFVKMIKEMYLIAERVSTTHTPTYAERMELQQAMNRLTIARFQTTDGLEQWERAIGQRLRGNVRFRENTLGWIDNTVITIGDALTSSFGIRRFTSPYFRKIIGRWSDQDFRENDRIIKKWEVTEHLTVPGEHKVMFSYTGRGGISICRARGEWTDKDFQEKEQIVKKWETAEHLPTAEEKRKATFWYVGRGERLTMYRVALATAPADNPDQLTELSVDQHKGVSTRGHRISKDVYTVTLKQRDPKARYFIVADVRSGWKNFASSREGCKGIVWMKAPAPNNWDGIQASTDLRPMTDEELARANLPKFTGKGLRVGVVQGGYGSISILDYLRAVDGIDALPLSSPNKFMIETCQLVVLPLLKRDEAGRRMCKPLRDAFRNYVQEGGGLVMTGALTLDGYADICKFKRHGGSSDFIPWIAVTEHPVTQGIEMNKPLPGTGWCVEFERGANGVAVAISAKSRDPVVVVGEFGKGRLVICGLAPGSRPGEEVALTGAKTNLLENAVRWCGRMK